MERPILTLTSKDFFTGIASGAFTDRGGLFLAAEGVTPIYDPGGTASTQNGLLQGSPTPTDISGAVVVDTVFAGESGFVGSTPYLFMLGNAGHFYRKPVGAGAPVDIRSGTPITNPANGMTIWGPAGGTKLLYFWQKTQIGTWDLSGTHPTGWTDNVYTGLTSVAYHPVHQFVGNVYYGNVAKLGAISDAGSGSASHSTNVLDLPQQYGITALSDDGTYLVIAATENLEGASMFSANKVYFWDTFSPSWAREYEIRDPFIWALKKIGGAVYAFGQNGIYEVTFAGGVKKLPPAFTAFGTPADLISGFGASRATVYNSSALMFGTDTTVDTFGKMSPDLPNAYFKPLRITGGGTPTFISASLDVGRVYVATDAGKLYEYDWNDTTHETGVSAQTAHISLPGKYRLTRINAILGAPLASGDSFKIFTKTDEVNPSVLYNTISYALHGAVQNKVVIPAAAKEVISEKPSFYLNFDTGAVKVKKVEVYGQPLEP